MTIATSYATLGEDALAYGLNEGEVKVIFAGAEQLGTIGKVASKVPTLKDVIYMGKADDKVLSTFKKDAPNLTLITLDELRKSGSDKPAEPVAPKPEGE